MDDIAHLLRQRGQPATGEIARTLIQMEKMMDADEREFRALTLRALGQLLGEVGLLKLQMKIQEGT